MTCSGEDFRHTNTSNHKDYLEEDFPLWLLILSTVYFILVIVFGTVGNGLILMTFANTRTLWKNSLNVLIFSSTVVNFIISAFIDPICASANFLFGNEACEVVLDFTEFFLIVCAVSSLYTQTAVAANRYLLIAYPNTTYRTCCARRKSIVVLIVVIWVVSILAMSLQWMVYEILHEDEDVYSIEFLIFITVVYVFNYLPLIAIPCFHFLTLRVIRASRNRVEATGIVRALKPQDGLQARKFPSIGTNSTVELAAIKEPLGTAGHSGKNNSLLKSSLNSPAHSELPTISTKLQAASKGDKPRTRKSLIAPSTKPLDPEVSSSRNISPQFQKKHVNPEMMMIRMMISMYVILLLAWFPSLSILFSFDKWEQIYDDLTPFRCFIPLYSTLLPYVIVWTNKHFRTAVKKRFRRSVGRPTARN